MTPELHRQISTLYHQALELGSHERSAFLDRACVGDEDLRREVESLLAAHEKADDYFTDAIDAAARLLTPRELAGRRLKQYEFLSLIGAGGMGQVYQAHDHNLGRDVAIKVLSPEFAKDPDKLARLRREARVLATLNHPSIAAIYDVQESDAQEIDGMCGLVLELVAGKTLAEHIATGSLYSSGKAIDTVLRIAIQICDALDAAHERGVVHRDLKPANIKITPAGQVKLLDFGLAQMFESDAQQDSLSRSATAARTAEGVIVGTAAYMSPEQARGEKPDRRADIWAFGCVVYEMLTGERAFRGETTIEILGEVLKTDPDWTLLPEATPPAIRTLLKRCLTKATSTRLRDIADARFQIEEVLAEPLPQAAIATPAAPIPQSRNAKLKTRFSFTTVLVALAALAVPAALYRRESPPAEMRLQIVTPPTLDPLYFALAPDGRRLVLVARGSPDGAPQRLYVRTLDTMEATPIAGTEGARLPFWSADSRSIGFFASGKLFRVDITGGAPQELATAVNPQGGAWGVDDKIVFAPNTVSPLLRVSASGGKAVAVTTVDSPRQSGHLSPSLLPDGRRFLFRAIGEPEVSGIYLGSLDQEAPKRLLAANTTAAYLTPDLLIYVQQGAVVARKLDADRGKLIGDPVTIVNGVRGAQTGFSVSATGSLAVRTSIGAAGRLTWFDRNGAVTGRGGDLNAPELSPGDRYVAYDRTIEGNRDVWIMDLLRDALTPFTRNPAVDGFPVWSPDGSRIAFHSQRKGTFDIWIKPASGASAEELLYGTTNNEWPLDWSRDGRFLLYRTSDQNYTSSDLWALPMTGSNSTPMVVANSPFEERMGEFSPDGKWVVYETEEFGRPQIVARAFPVAGGIVNVSTNGGISPRWSAEGKEIYFVALDGMMMAVSAVTAGSALTAGKPQPLFSTQIVGQPFKFQYAVSRGGRFLVHSRHIDESAVPPITLILNWKYPAK